MITIRLRIRDLHEDANLTQKQVINYFDFDESLYSKYEREERPIPLEVMIKLAQFYHTTIDYLVGLTDNRSLQ